MRNQTINRAILIVLTAFTSQCEKEPDRSDVSAYLSARAFKASKNTMFLSDSTESPEKKCEIIEGSLVVLKGPPRYASNGLYKATLEKPLPNCDLSEGYLHMIDFPMNDETPALPIDANAKIRPHLRLTNTGVRDDNRLFVLTFDLIAPDGTVIDSVKANSGAPSRQTFRSWKESVAGTSEPIPEGEWILDPGYARNGLIFAANWGNFNRDFYQTDQGNTTAALGPAFAPVYYRHLDRDRSTHVNGRFRSEVGIHLDAGSPGTGGCIGIRGMESMKRVVSWFENSEVSPRQIFVDWNLGTASTFPKSCKVNSADGEANVRTEASGTSAIRLQLPNGSTIRAVSDHNGWYAVTFSLDAVKYGGSDKPVFIHKKVLSCQ